MVIKREVFDRNPWAVMNILDVGADTLVVIDGDWDQTIRLDGIGNAKTVTQTDFLLSL